MLRTRLVRWSSKQGGYVIDQAVRTVLENALRAWNPELWSALHRAAYGLYAEWINKYPRAKRRWDSEMVYHVGWLNEANPAM
jgi:hypothetical protein